MVRRNGTMNRNNPIRLRKNKSKNDNSGQSVSFTGSVPGKAIALADVLRPSADIVNELNEYTASDENCDFGDIRQVNKLLVVKLSFKLININ